MKEITKEDKKIFYLIFIPTLILVFFPFPSKLLGYSMTLYISDFILIGYLLINCFRKHFKVPKNKNMIILLTIICINILGILIGAIKNETNLRQLTEFIRTMEWIVIYIYFYNVFISARKQEIIGKIIIKVFFLIIILLIPFIIIELFNLPFKSLLKNLYELSKSGNIFQYYNRITGTFRNPNMFGIWLTIAISAIQVSNIKNVKKIIFLLISIGMLYFTGSRTAIIIAIVVIGMIYFFQFLQKNNNKTKVRNLIVIFSLIIMCIIIVNNRPDLFYSVRLLKTTEDASDLNGRAQIWEKYSDDIENNLLLGNGIAKSDNIVFDNLYIQYIYYYGMLGISILLILFISNLYKTIIMYKKEDNKTFVLYIMAVQIIVIISGLTIQILDALQIVYFYIMTMSFIDSRLLMLKNKPKIEVNGN